MEPMIEAPPAAGDREPDAAASSESSVVRDEQLVELDLLIEDVSIDGMCGVY